MSNDGMKNASLSVLLGMLAFIPIGCQGVKPWDLVINKTTPASIEVDLIGINEIVKPAWEGYDVDQYWTPGDSRRANAEKLTMNLPTGQPWIVRKDDPHWRSWIDHGATELLIMANLPGHFAPGPTDPRRIFLPLDKHRWKAKGDTLEIEVQDTIVRPITP
jgi:hypothetical protein